MKNYRENNGCHNCTHCFVYSEYDCDARHYCTKNAPPRPLCNSVLLDENHFFDNPSDEVWEKRRTEWEEWSNNQSVSPSGICDLYDKKS